MPDRHLDQAVLRVITRIAPDRDRLVQPESRLIHDLGFQSLAVAELGFALTDLFAITITPEAAFELNTVADVVDLVRTRIASGPARMPPPETLAQWEADYLDDDEPARP